jgi:Restriction endonuclease
VQQLDFTDFDETEFEEFCFQLLKGLPGFHNVDWRKGTPKSTSPADRGRDIAAEVDHVEVDGARHVETWFVDCKHYERGIPPEALQGLLAWAQAERPNVALIIASGFLSNAAKDYLRDFEQNNRPPFRIKYWERPTLVDLALNDKELLERFFTSGTPFEPTNAEHVVQCELAECKHPAVYVIDGNPAATALGWCELCRAVARQQEQELVALGARRKRPRNSQGSG